MTLRYGLIGYGRFGRLHARCIAGADGASLAAVCVPGDASASAATADHPGVRIHRDYLDLVRDPEVDVVDVVAPNSLHAEMTLAALDAGKHVLVEKPMATTREDCDRVVDRVARTGRLLNVGFELRLSTQWATIKQLVDDGAIGAPHYAHLALFRYPYRAGASGWRHDESRVGSWILEEPVHFYDLIMWYLAALGRPVKVSAWGGAGAGSSMTANFSSTLEFAGGAHAVVTQSLAGFGHHLVLEIAGEQGAMRATWSAEDAASRTPSAALWLNRAGSPRAEAVPLEAPSGEVFELEREIALTTEGFAAGRTLVGAEEGRAAVIVCLEAERAMREGRPVEVRY